jgi:hypothetical protein
MANRLLIGAAVVLSFLPSCAGPPRAADVGAMTSPGGTATVPQIVVATPPNPATSAAAERRGVKWIDLQPGDCLAEPPPTDPAVVTVAVIDCAAPHRAETFLRAQVPVNTALIDNATAQCQAGLGGYAGAAADRYRITYLIDSEQDRTFNNPLPSTVICLLEDADGQWLTGSGRGQR